MSLRTESCYIYSENKSLPAVYLPDKQEIFVGRSVDTKIQDTQCSREQVLLYASYADRKVFVQQVGVRPCGFNGYKTERGVRFIAQHGDILEVLYGKHSYKIEFNPPERTNVDIKRSTKRSLLEDSIGYDSSSLKKVKLHTDASTKGDMEQSVTRNDDVPSTSYGSLAESTKKIINYTEFGRWEKSGNDMLYIYTTGSCEGRSKIAAFDMDKTLINTISGATFPKDANDWKILYPNVLTQLKQHYDDGYKVVVFSNQANLGMGRISLEDFKSKVEKIARKIGIPMQVYLAAGHNIYRKPCPGMWHFLLNEMNDGVTVDKDKSFFVGDAAGRPVSSSRKKKDHSLADRLFAINLDLTFYTPEEHFLNHKKDSYTPPPFHPKQACQNTQLLEPRYAKLTSNQQEIIVMVGSPGSGKSHFAKTHLMNYGYINRDTLGSMQKCIAKATEMLCCGRSVVIDNTNPDVSTRQKYIDVAKEQKLPVRCFLMDLSKEHIKHNNIYRILTDPVHQKINEMIINSYMKKYVIPSADEGFAEIVKVNFVPAFESAGERELYEMYLLG